MRQADCGLGHLSRMGDELAKQETADCISTLTANLDSAAEILSGRDS